MSNENVYQFSTGNFSTLFPRLLKIKTMFFPLQILLLDKLS